VDLYVLRRGRPIATDTTVTARLVFGASATAAVYAVSTNYAVTNNSYLCQVSTVGTNSAAAPNGLWWYTVYFDRSGKTFWTGSGELVIEKTTSTADGTVWQEITTSAEVSAHNTNTAAHADIRAMATNATDAVARSHLTESSNTVHGGFIKTAYDWATNAYAYAGRAWDQATNALAIAQTAFGWGDHADAGYVTGDVVRAESDPIWAAVSNAIRTHTESAHSANPDSGFQGGTEACATTGGAIGLEAMAASGGAAGYRASAGSGGAIGELAYTENGFAGGYNAIASESGTIESPGINAIQLGTGGNTNPLSLQIYGYPLMNPDGTIPLDRTPSLLTTNAPEWIAVTNGAALGATALQPASTNGWTVTSHDGLVPTNRTITVNGQVGTLNSNVAFTVMAAYTNGTTHGDGVLDGTNGVWWTKGDTNFWFLFN
jgi:hypothetical protein